MGKVNFKTLAKINNISPEESELILLESGNRLGPESRYEIINLIGVGSVGAVYLAKDYEENEKLIALKIILPHLLEDEENLELFIDIISEVKGIVHPNIVNIEDFWKQSNLYFYTMDYIQGPSCFQWQQKFEKKEESVPLSIACSITRDIIECFRDIDYTGHFILHPNNIILSSQKKEEQTPIITDIGLYQLKSNQFWAKATEILGFSGYISPELLLNEVLTNKADMYSIGVFLYKMLYRAYPVKILNNSDVIPQNLLHFFRQTLDTSPDNRFKNFDDALDLLELVAKNTSNNNIIIERESRTERLKRITEKELLLKQLSEEDEVEEKKISYEEYVEEGKKELEDQNYEKALELLKEAYSLDKNQEIVELMTQAHESLKEVKKMKNDAKHLASPYESFDLLEKGYEINPHDKEIHQALSQKAKEIEKTEKKAIELLEEGDRLVGENRFEEAIEVWKQMPSDTYKFKEGNDRIMQVVDMLGEQAREVLDSGNSYEAKKIIEKAVKYSQDPYIMDLDDEITREIDEKEKVFLQIWQEGEKHFEKKQYKAAINVWESVLGTTQNDEHLREKIEQANMLQENFENDEEEYLRLMSAARTLEGREDYQGALSAMERIRQKKWVCPIDNPTPKIESLTKLVAAGKYSQQMLDKLSEIKKYLKKNKLAFARETLDNPMFSRKMIPSVKNKYQRILEELEEQTAKKKKTMMITFGVIILILIVVAVYFLKG